VSDTSGGSGTWTYTLTVDPPSSGSLTQTDPLTGQTIAGTPFSDQLVMDGADGDLTYVTTDGGGGPVTVSETGAVSAPDDTPAGVYTVSGTVSDTSGSTGTWTYTLTVDPAPPGVATVTLDRTHAVYDGSPHAVGVTTDPPGLPVEVRYDGELAPPTAVGRYDITVLVTDPDYVTDPSPVTGTLVIDRASQAIQLTAPRSASYRGQSATVEATATSGLRVRIQVSGACVRHGDELEFWAAGTCVVVARQPGNHNWMPAPAVTRRLSVDKATPTVQLTASSRTSGRGERVTFTAKVLVPRTGAAPVHAVVFTTAGHSVRVHLNAHGVARWTVASLRPGSYTVVARYVGDRHYLAARSAPLPHRVVRAARAGRDLQ
jgi:hypothetical protein